MASLLVISLLIFNGYANGPGSDSGTQVSGQQLDPISKAENVNQVIHDAASLQRQALEKQLQQ